MELIERCGQLRRLDQLFSDCQNLSGGIAVVNGSVGSGKTDFLLTALEKVRRAGAVVLDATGVAAEQHQPLGLLAQLLCSDALTPAERVRAEKLLADAARAIPPGHVYADDYPCIKMMKKIWMIIREISERAPVVIGIDDLQFTDAASYRCLRYIGTRLRFSRILMILTRPVGQPDSDHQLGAGWTGSSGQRRFERIQLPLLSRQGVAEMLGGQFGLAAAHRASFRWHDLTGGNPLLVRALREETREAVRHIGPESVEPAVGGEFTAAVLACLRAAGAGFLSVARVLVLLGAERPLGELAELLGMRIAAVERILAAMDNAGVLARLSHHAVRVAVLADVPASTRVDLRCRAARILHEGGAAASDVARQLIDAGQAPGSWALETLLRAGDEALRADDLDLATRCLLLASVSCVTDGQRGAATMLLAKTEWRTDPAVAIRRLRPLTSALRNGGLSDAWAGSLIMPLLWHGRAEEALVAMERLHHASDLDPNVDAELFIAAHWLRSTQPMLARRLPRASERSPGAAVDHVPTRPLMQAAAALTDILCNGADEAAVHAAERGLEAMRLSDSTLGPIESALRVLIYGGRLDLAVDRCDTLLREAQARGAPTWLAVLASVRAEIAMRLGKPSAAENYAQTALAYIPPGSWGVAIGGPLSSQVLAATAMGNRAGAAECLRLPVPDELFHTRFGLQYLYARGLNHIANDRHHAALDDLFACGELMAQWGIDRLTFLPWRADAAVLLLDLGRTAEACKLVGEQIARTGSGWVRTRGISLRFMAAAGDVRRRPSLLVEAAKIFQACGDQVQLAFVLRDLSRAHRMLGETDRARAAERRAARLAEDRRAESIPDSRSFPDTPVRPTRFGLAANDRAASLSRAERRVATLAVAGRSNREISERLAVTVSTVEQHLTRIYRKLGISSRADLPGSFSGMGPPPRRPQPAGGGSSVRRFG